jgi:uncharacterized protein YkwD
MDGPPAPVDPPAIWAEATSSPVALVTQPATALEREALAHCGGGDEGLRRAANRALSRALASVALPDADALEFAQRSSGEPHPWARAWAASGRTLSRDATLRELDEWLADDPDPRLRRCAVASGVAPDGTRALAVVAIDALADLSPLPTRARTGQWLSIGARLRVPAGAGEVLVLGPNGAPRRVPVWFDGETLRARFALDRPGQFTIQVVVSTATGPRPVLEASVFADAEPPAQATQIEAPGEEAASPGGEGDRDEVPDDAVLASMLAEARAASGEPALTRDARLDAAARQHARAMARARLVAHDAGDGDPSERMQAAGLSWGALGENVAHAATLALAHRSLWASPSHRANMLRRDFERVGVGVVRGERGDVWVVETFASAVH